MVCSKGYDPGYEFAPKIAGSSGHRIQIFNIISSMDKSCPVIWIRYDTGYLDIQFTLGGLAAALASTPLRDVERQRLLRGGDRDPSGSRGGGNLGRFSLGSGIHYKNKGVRIMDLSGLAANPPFFS